MGMYVVCMVIFSTECITHTSLRECEGLTMYLVNRYRLQERAALGARYEQNCMGVGTAREAHLAPLLPMFPKSIA